MHATTGGGDRGGDGGVSRWSKPFKVPRPKPAGAAAVVTSVAKPAAPVTAPAAAAGVGGVSSSRKSGDFVPPRPARGGAAAAAGVGVTGEGGGFEDWVAATEAGMGLFSTGRGSSIAVSAEAQAKAAAMLADIVGEDMPERAAAAAAEGDMDATLGLAGVANGAGMFSTGRGGSIRITPEAQARAAAMMAEVLGDDPVVTAAGVAAEAGGCRADAAGVQDAGELGLGGAAAMFSTGRGGSIRITPQAQARAAAMMSDVLGEDTADWPLAAAPAAAAGGTAAPVGMQPAGGVVDAAAMFSSSRGGSIMITPQAQARAAAMMADVLGEDTMDQPAAATGGTATGGTATGGAATAGAEAPVAMQLAAGVGVGNQAAMLSTGRGSSMLITPQAQAKATVMAAVLGEDTAAAAAAGGAAAAAGGAAPVGMQPAGGVMDAAAMFSTGRGGSITITPQAQAKAAAMMSDFLGEDPASGAMPAAAGVPPPAALPAAGAMLRVGALAVATPVAAGAVGGPVGYFTTGRGSNIKITPQAQVKAAALMSEVWGEDAPDAMPAPMPTRTGATQIAVLPGAGEVPALSAAEAPMGAPGGLFLTGRGGRIMISPAAHARASAMLAYVLGEDIAGPPAVAAPMLEAAIAAAAHAGRVALPPRPPGAVGGKGVPAAMFSTGRDGSITITPEAQARAEGMMTEVWDRQAGGGEQGGPTTRAGAVAKEPGGGYAAGAAQFVGQRGSAAAAAAGQAGARAPSPSPAPESPSAATEAARLSKAPFGAEAAAEVSRCRPQVPIPATGATAVGAGTDRTLHAPIAPTAAAAVSVPSPQIAVAEAAAGDANAPEQHSSMLPPLALLSKAATAATATTSIGSVPAAAAAAAGAGAVPAVPLTAAAAAASALVVSNAGVTLNHQPMLGGKLAPQAEPAGSMFVSSDPADVAGNPPIAVVTTTIPPMKPLSQQEAAAALGSFHSAGGSSIGWTPSMCAAAVKFSQELGQEQVVLVLGSTEHGQQGQAAMAGVGRTEGLVCEDMGRGEAAADTSKPGGNGALLAAAAGARGIAAAMNDPTAAAAGEASKAAEGSCEERAAAGAAAGGSSAPPLGGSFSGSGGSYRRGILLQSIEQGTEWDSLPDFCTAELRAEFQKKAAAAAAGRVAAAAPAAGVRFAEAGVCQQQQQQERQQQRQQGQGQQEEQQQQTQGQGQGQGNILWQEAGEGLLPAGRQPCEVPISRVQVAAAAAAAATGMVAAGAEASVRNCVRASKRSSPDGDEGRGAAGNAPCKRRNSSPDDEPVPMETDMQEHSLGQGHQGLPSHGFAGGFGGGWATGGGRALQIDKDAAKAALARLGVELPTAAKGREEEEEGHGEGEGGQPAGMWVKEVHAVPAGNLGGWTTGNGTEIATDDVQTRAAARLDITVRHTEQQEQQQTLRQNQQAEERQGVAVPAFGGWATGHGTAIATDEAQTRAAAPRLGMQMPDRQQQQQQEEQQAGEEQEGEEQGQQRAGGTSQQGGEKPPLIPPVFGGWATGNGTAIATDEVQTGAAAARLGIPMSCRYQQQQQQGWEAEEGEEQGEQDQQEQQSQKVGGQIQPAGEKAQLAVPAFGGWATGNGTAIATDEAQTKAAAARLGLYLPNAHEQQQQLESRGRQQELEPQGFSGQAAAPLVASRGWATGGGKALAIDEAQSRAAAARLGISVPVAEPQQQQLQQQQEQHCQQEEHRQMEVSPAPAPLPRGFGGWATGSGAAIATDDVQTKAAAARLGITLSQTGCEDQEQRHGTPPPPAAAAAGALAAQPSFGGWSTGSGAAIGTDNEQTKAAAARLGIALPQAGGVQQEQRQGTPSPPPPAAPAAAAQPSFGGWVTGSGATIVIDDKQAKAAAARLGIGIAATDGATVDTPQQQQQQQGKEQELQQQQGKEQELQQQQGKKRPPVHTPQQQQQQGKRRVLGKLPPFPGFSPGGGPGQSFATPLSKRARGLSGAPLPSPNPGIAPRPVPAHAPGVGGTPAAAGRNTKKETGSDAGDDGARNEAGAALRTPFTGGASSASPAMGVVQSVPATALDQLAQGIVVATAAVEGAQAVSPSICLPTGLLTTLCYKTPAAAAAAVERVGVPHPTLDKGDFTAVGEAPQAAAAAAATPGDVTPGAQASDKIAGVTPAISARATTGVKRTGSVLKKGCRQQFKAPARTMSLPPLPAGPLLSGVEARAGAHRTEGDKQAEATGSGAGKDCTTTPAAAGGASNACKGGEKSTTKVGGSSSSSAVVVKESMQEYFELPAAGRWASAGFRVPAAAAAPGGVVGLPAAEGAAAAGMDAAAAGAYAFPASAVPPWAQKVLGPGAPCDAAAVRQLLVAHGLAPPTAAPVPTVSAADGMHNAGTTETAGAADVDVEPVEGVEAAGAIAAAAGGGGGVDEQYATAAWVANHFKWIVWKLASYDSNMLPAGNRARQQQQQLPPGQELQASLTLINVLQQLQFRCVQRGC